MKSTRISPHELLTRHIQSIILAEWQRDVLLRSTRARRERTRICVAIWRGCCLIAVSRLRTAAHCRACCTPSWMRLSSLGRNRPPADGCESPQLCHIYGFWSRERDWTWGPYLFAAAGVSIRRDTVHRRESRILGWDEANKGYLFQLIWLQIFAKCAGAAAVLLLDLVQDIFRECIAQRQFLSPCLISGQGELQDDGGSSFW